MTLMDADNNTRETVTMDEQYWARIIDLFNTGIEGDDEDELCELADGLIRSMEGGGKMPADCVISPRLIRDGFINLLYRIRG
jgi:hypothetical protein